MFTRYSFGVFLGVLLVTSTPSQAVDIPANRLESNPLTLKVVPGKATTLHFDNGEVIEHFVVNDDTQLIYHTNQLLAVDIPANRLESNPLILKVVPGKATTLHFDNGEVIEHFVVSDDSQLIYNTNQPPGQATTFILRQIEELPTPGATITSEPNIIINTRSPDGDGNVYQVVVQFAPPKTVTDSELLWRVVSPSYSPTEQTINTGLGQANLNHLQLGLAHLLSTGQLNNDDEIVAQIRTLFVKAKSLPLQSAAHQANIPVQVLYKLGEIGLKAQREKLDFLVPLVHQGIPSIKIGKPDDSANLTPETEE